MTRKKAVEHLDITLRDLRGNDNIMGGVLVLFYGHFCQILPIIPRLTPADEIHACMVKTLIILETREKDKL